MRRSRPSILLTLAALGLATMLAPTRPAQAAQIPAPLALALEGCGCGIDRASLIALRDQIAAAPGAAAARELAFSQVQLASNALGHAQRLLPWSSDLSAARERLGRYEQLLARAASPADAAADFSELMQLGTAEPRAASCDYTTGEIIAIVLGFILGIIPGLILLILLC